MTASSHFLSDSVFIIALSFDVVFSELPTSSPRNPQVNKITEPNGNVVLLTFRRAIYTYLRQQAYVSNLACTNKIWYRIALLARVCGQWT
jgi:hypothetical protein